MSEATRQRWLHVHNRMQELNGKYGALVDEPLPPGWVPQRRLGIPDPVEEPPPTGDLKATPIAIR